MARTTTAKVSLGIVLLFLGLGVLGYCMRFTLWRTFPRLRWLLAHSFVIGSQMRGLGKEDVQERLGRPDAVRHSATVFIDNPTEAWEEAASISMRLDSDNRITAMVYHLGSNTPSASKLPFVESRWRVAGSDVKRSMAEDVVRQWSLGAWATTNSSLEFIESYLGPAQYVDYWLYRLTDWRSLDVHFDRSGLVQEVIVGHEEGLRTPKDTGTPAAE